MGISAVILWISGGQSILILNQQLSDKSWGPHTGRSRISRTLQLLLLGQWNQSKSPGLHSGDGGRKQKQTHEATRNSCSRALATAT